MAVVFSVIPRSQRGTLRKAIGFLVGIIFLFQLQAEPSRFLMDSWGTENGLPDDFVTSLIQTPDGYLWIGTYNGLARFDGVRFEAFKPANTPELGHARIVKLFLDAQGTLWINTYDGSLVSWRNGVFTREWNGEGKGNSEVWLVSDDSRQITFAFRSGLLIRRSLERGATNDWTILKPPGNPPGAFYCEDAGAGLWCSTLDGKLWRIINDRFEVVSPQQNGLRGVEIHWLAADLSQRIWVGTEKEIARWDGKQFQTMNPNGESDLNVDSFFFSPDGGALVAAGGRVRKYLNRQWISEFQKLPDLSQEQMLQQSLFRDREGGLWQISRGMGIVHITPDNATQQISVPDGLPGDHTTSWLEDREGNFWVGLAHGGIVRLRKKSFQVLGMPGGVADRAAMSVCEDKTGAVWVGTYGGGLNCWRNGTVTNFPVMQSSGGFVFSVFPDEHGRLWMSAGMEDIFLFQDEQMTSAPVAVHGVKSILIDRKGNVWMGRKDGVARWADGKLEVWDSHHRSIAKPVRALAEDRAGRIWAGADDAHLYRFDGEKIQAFPLPEFPTDQAVWSLLADEDGSVWIGTADAGLLHFESGKFVRFTAKNGLPDNIICQLLDDRRGNLWIGTRHGICRVDKNALRAFAARKTPTISCSIYDRADGLPSPECSDMYQPCAWRGRDGKLWFATEKGVVMVQPDEIPLNRVAPPVAIEEFLIDGRIYKTATSPAVNSPVLKVPPGKQNFEFHYTALSLADPQKVRFRYKLEGFDSVWVDAGNRRWVQYNYLKPGNYRFHVMAANNDGVWNEAGATMVLRVLPHFWDTWWFMASLGLALTAGVAGVARYISHRELRRELERLERQRGIEQDRSRIARDIHDHIGSGLTRINLLNELLLGEPVEQLPDRVGQITGVTCDLMRAMDEIVWAVNPKNDTLDSLMNYLCDFADEYLRVASIRLRINVPTPLPAWHLSSEVRHNIFLTTKEILNNIVKHSEATEVYFGLKLEVAKATIEIRDNGRGFQTPLDSPGNGLENLRKRASAIGGSCLITSAVGKGTKIELTVPGPQPNGK